MGADDGTGGTEAQAHALLAGAAGLDAAVEGREHPLQVFGFQARPAIANLDHRLVALDVQGDPGAVTILDGVVEEIGEDPLQAQH